MDELDDGSGREPWDEDEDEGEPLHPLLVGLTDMINEFLVNPDKDVPALSIALNRYFWDLEFDPETTVHFTDAKKTDWAARQLMPSPPVNVTVKFSDGVKLIFDVNNESLWCFETGNDPDYEPDDDSSFFGPFEHVTAALIGAAKLNAIGASDDDDYEPDDEYAPEGDPEPDEDSDQWHPLMRQLLQLRKDYEDTDDDAIPALAVALNDLFWAVEADPETAVFFCSEDGKRTNWAARQRMPDPPVDIAVRFPTVQIWFIAYGGAIWWVDEDGPNGPDLDQAWPLTFKHTKAALSQAAALNAAGVG